MQKVILVLLVILLSSPPIFSQKRIDKEKVRSEKMAVEKEFEAFFVTFCAKTKSKKYAACNKLSFLILEKAFQEN